MFRFASDDIHSITRAIGEHVTTTHTPPVSAEFADGIMDNGTVQHPLLQYPVNIFSPDECLQAAKQIVGLHKAASSGVATHALVWPGETAEVSLLRTQDCLSLYTLVGQAIPHVEVGLVEHTMSYISRLSLVVHLTDTEFVTDMATLNVARAIHGCIFGGRKLVQTEGPEGTRDPVCMLLRQQSGHKLQMHWPNVCLLYHDLARLSDGLLDILAECSALMQIKSIHLRGASGQAPMYGSAASEGEQPFLFWQWLYEEGVYPLHLDLGKHHGQYIVTESNIRLALPFLYSLNPVATRVAIWQWHSTTESSVPAWQLLGLPDPGKPQVASAFYVTDDNAWDRQVNAVQRLLGIIDGRTVARQMETGLHVHGALHGGWVGFCLWIRWVGAAMQTNGGEPRPWYEYYEKWQRFGSSHAHASSLRMLHTLANSDDPVRFKLFVELERRQDHPNRDTDGGEESLIQLFGSLHHLDIARFLRHEVHDEMTCVSTSRPTQWYIYEHADHRWHYDGDGPSCTLRCYKLISSYVNTCRESTREQPDEGGDSSGGQQRNGSKAALHVMVNFPEDFNRKAVSKQTLVHLESSIGDIRNMRCVMQAMQLFLHNPRFLSHLDTRNDHIIPFANGVLDLSQGCLRPGIPQDLVSKGPSYTWHDYKAGDAREIERILTTIFPDTTLRDFFLQVGASLLRKRNRYKHFYVLSGNTNGGKSFLLSIVKQAFGSLFTQLPITAITCRESDPTNHSDYLYRTAGCNIAVMHEPDSATQRILPDRVKGLTSDSDEVSCRPIFGQATTISIPWKLFLLCNTIPPLANVDAATVERTQIIPFVSTFSSIGVPDSEKEQFATRLFLANRTLDVSKVEELGQRLMAVFWATYQRYAMHSAAYTLRVPQQIRLGVERYMRDVSLFRVWCSAFLRPTTPLCKRNTFMPRSVDHDLQSQAMDVLRNIRRFTASGPAQPMWADMDTATRRDTTVPGSQGWVHAQCCMMWETIMDHMLWGNGLSHADKCTVGIAAVDLATVVGTFNAFRSRNRVPQDLCNSKNTAQQNADEATSDDTTSKVRSSMAARGLRTSLPMDLDIGLVAQIVRETVGRDAYDALQLGVALITDQPQTAYTETDCVSASMVESALLSCASRWEVLYGIPMPHVGLVDTHVLRGATQEVRVCLQSTEPLRSGSLTDANVQRIVNERRALLGQPVWQRRKAGTGDELNPMLADNPTNWDQACQLIRTASLHSATTLADLEQKSRIHGFTAGFSGVGSFPACVPEPTECTADDVQQTHTFYDRAWSHYTPAAVPELHTPDSICQQLRDSLV